MEYKYIGGGGEDSNVKLNKIGSDAWHALFWNGRGCDGCGGKRRDGQNLSHGVIG